MSKYGSQSMVAPLKRVAVRRPPAALASADPDVWSYTDTVDLECARNEHQTFVELLQAAGAEVVFIDSDPDVLPDSMFAHDASMITCGGALLMRMGKSLRRDETILHETLYNNLGIPIMGKIEAPGTVEAGDTLWLNKNTLAVGRSYRTNESGIQQLRNLLARIGVDVIAFDMPVYRGKNYCLHLMSVVSLLADNLALVHSPLMPVSLFELMKRSGYELLVAPLDEFEASNTVSGNILAVRPRYCILVDGLPKTRRILETAGCEVLTFPGVDVCIKAEGGPTCLTRPLLRQH